MQAHLINTTDASAISTTTAASGGNITDDAGSPVTARGVCYGTTPNPTTGSSVVTCGSGVGSFTAQLTGLTPNTLYHIRAFATNSVSTYYGEELSFTTLSGIVSLTTTAITTITTISAASGGNITNDGGVAVSSRGVCYSTSPNPTTGNSVVACGSGVGSFTAQLTGLSPNTLYHIRAYATNSVNTYYGDELSFTTAPAGTWFCGFALLINHVVTGGVAPVDKTVSYGSITNIPGEPTKCWITSNLGATDQATAVDDASETAAGWYWQFNSKQGFKHDGTTRTPATTWIGTIAVNSDWLTANNPCTLELGSGWRLPTTTEWANVDASGGWTNLNGPYGSGLKLHAAGILEANNGFLADRGTYGNYWSKMQYLDDWSWGECIHFNSGFSGAACQGKASGISVRCIKD